VLDDFWRWAKQKEAREKELEKEVKKLKEEMKKEQIEKNVLYENIKKAGGAVSEKMRQKMLQDALSPNYSKPQMDRMLYGKKTHWTSEDITSAISLYGMGSRNYRAARNMRGVFLPSVSCLKRFAANLALKPGPLKEVYFMQILYLFHVMLLILYLKVYIFIKVIQLMGIKSKSMTKLEKVAVVCFDEMKVAQRIEYDRAGDVVIGPCRYVQVYVKPLKN